MTSKSRPLFCFNPDPRLVWNKVPGAVSYKFSLLYRDPENSENLENLEEFWSIEVSEPQCDAQGTCQCLYPSDKPLKPLVCYWLIAEANNGKSTPKKFQTEVILLEEKDQKACQEIEILLEEQGTKELMKQWLLVKKAFCNHTPPPTWRPRGSYIGCSFY